MIDALDTQIAPLDKQMRAYARRQARMQGTARALRNRADHLGHGRRRARRPQPILILPRSRSLRRP
jgi:hypothetical protein